jgi:hypothetical protein
VGFLEKRMVVTVEELLSVIGELLWKSHGAAREPTRSGMSEVGSRYQMSATNRD